MILKELHCYSNATIVNASDAPPLWTFHRHVVFLHCGGGNNLRVCCILCFMVKVKTSEARDGWMTLNDSWGVAAASVLDPRWSDLCVSVTLPTSLLDGFYSVFMYYLVLLVL